MKCLKYATFAALGFTFTVGNVAAAEALPGCGIVKAMALEASFEKQNAEYEAGAAERQLNVKAIELSEAIAENNDEKIEEILKEFPDASTKTTPPANVVTAITAAAKAGNAALIAKLAQNPKINVNEISVSELEYTPLLHAFAKGHLEAAKALVDAKADVKATDQKGAGVVSIAVESQFPQLVEYALELGKEHNLPMDSSGLEHLPGSTPLGLAHKIEDESAKVKIIKMLQEAGATKVVYAGQELK